MHSNALLIEQMKIAVGLSPKVPSSAVPAWVNLKNYERCAIVINVTNGATGITGSAISLLQAQGVAGTGSKELPFSRAWLNPLGQLGDALTEFPVTDNTFTPAADANAELQYVIELMASDLDVNNGFNAVRAVTGDGAATTIGVNYLLWPARYGGHPWPSALVD